jgi:hypothetical protein
MCQSLNNAVSELIDVKERHKDSVFRIYDLLDRRSRRGNHQTTGAHGFKERPREYKWVRQIYMS